MVPRKENWISMGKDISIDLGQLVDCGLDSHVETMIIISSFGGYLLVAWKSALVWVKHTEVFCVEWLMQ